MNSRFKFRVWSNKDQEYLDPDYYENFAITPDGVIHVGLTVDNGICDEFQSIPPKSLIIEQCTGLKDKNGKLIYEGDVLQAPGQTIAYKVQWAHHGFVVKTGFSSAKSYPISNCEMFEIIGNIHDDQFREVTKMMEDKYNGTNESKP